MDDNDKHDIAERIVAAFRDEFAALALPQEMHKEHHIFIQKWIDKQSKSEDRWDKIRVQVSGWMIVTVLAAIGTMAYTLVASYFKDHIK